MNNKRITIRDLVILAIYLSKEKQIIGRTKIQKILYLLSKKSRLNMGYEPYFYGPYSGDVSEVLQYAKQDGLINEGSDVFSKKSDENQNFDNKQYKYTLKNLQIGKELEEEFILSRVDILSNLKQIIEVLEGYNLNEIAAATKIDYILGKSSKNIEQDAKELGWKLYKPTIDKAIEILRKLDFDYTKN
jgi:uncharacterized protein YwgA